MAVIHTSFTRVQLAALAVGSRVPTLHTITVGVGGAALNSNTIPITASPAFLQADLQLNFDGEVYTVATDVPVGGTTITTVEPINPAIAAGVTATTIAPLQFLGGETADIAVEDSLISTRRFLSGKWNEQAKVMVGVTISLEGQLHDNDVAISNIIRPAAFSLEKEVFAVITRRNGDVYSGAFLVNGYSEPTGLDNIVRVAFTLSSQDAVAIPAERALT